MANKYVVVDLNDPRASVIADVISNKSAKKILGLLAERELSESELASTLKLPPATVSYTIKKLIDSGLVERAPLVLWSVKGRKVARYRVTQKKIIIEPIKPMRGVLPAVLVAGVSAFFIKIWSDAQAIEQSYSYPAAAPELMMKASDSAVAASSMSEGATHLYSTLSAASPLWAWFFIGALTALLTVLLWNWRRSL